MSKGWVKVHREIFDNFLYTEKPFCRIAAFIDLLLLANANEKEILFDGESVTVFPGQLITSIRKLSDRWGWSRTKTNKFLNVLQKQHMIQIESDKKKTRLTLINYGKFQHGKATEKPLKSHSKATEMTLKNTNKKEEERKEEKEDIYISTHQKIFKFASEKNIRNYILKEVVIHSFLDKLSIDSIMNAISRCEGKPVEYLIEVLKSMVIDKNKVQPLRKTKAKSTPKPKLNIPIHTESMMSDDELEQLKQMAKELKT